MKTRTGFVSNSSSSSFVVAFPHIPHNVDEVFDLLFDGAKNSSNIEYEFAQTIFAEISNQTPLTMKEIIEEFQAGYFIPTNDIEAKYSNLRSTDYMAYYRIENKIVKKRAISFAKKWVKDNHDSYFFYFSYGDEDGSYYSQMEHGNIFSKLPNQIISHH